MSNCSRCQQEIAQCSVASIIVSIRDPENIGSGGLEVSFCGWECAALWFNAQAGEILMPDLDSAYFEQQDT
jgi:hypothetical protein